MRDYEGVKISGTVLVLTPDPEDPSSNWYTTATVYEEQEYVVISQFGNYGRKSSDHKSGDVFLTREEIASLAKIAPLVLTGKKPGAEG